MRMTTVEFPGEAMTLRSQDGGVTVAIPIRIQRYCGRRQVVVPQGISATLNGQRAPTALQVALARGHRWLRQIEGEPLFLQKNGVPTLRSNQKELDGQPLAPD